MADLKILFVVQNFQHHLYAYQNHDFVLEVGKHADCQYVGLGYSGRIDGETQVDTIKRLYGTGAPDWILGRHWLSIPLRKEYGIKVTDIVGDIHVSSITDCESFNRNFDIVFMRCRYARRCFPTLQDYQNATGLLTYEDMLRHGCLQVVPKDYYLSRIKVPSYLLPFSLDPHKFMPCAEKKHDIFSSGVTGRCYPFRRKIRIELPRLAMEKGWKYLEAKPVSSPLCRDIRQVLGNPELRKEFFVGEDYAKAIAESKIFIFGSGICNYPIKKYFEGMMSGSLVMANMPFHIDELHFKPDWNIVEINDDNWKEKLAYYLEDDQLRETVARRGYETAMKYFTNEAMAKKFIEILKLNTEQGKK